MICAQQGLLTCPHDGHSLRFVGDEAGDHEGGDEGILICDGPADCDFALLVRQGIVVALPSRLVDARERRLLAKRVAAARSGAE